MSKSITRGKTRVWFLPAIASPTKAPTVAEFAAGTELSSQVADWAGFSFANQPADAMALDTDFDEKVPGINQAEDSSITFHLDTTSNPLRTTLAKGTEGFIVIADRTTAPAATDLVDVWPVTVGGTPKLRPMANETKRWRADLIVTDTPAEDIAVLA